MRDKQIEEMAEILYKENGHLAPDYYRPDAEALYNASYRKKSDVAREIFEEIEECMSCFEDDDDGYLLKKCEFEYFMRELKKKYESEGEG
jgi:hypothetical protein